jgi:hypothetical protein
MDENKNTQIEDIKEEKQSFSKWLDNFWYHYKWHTIAVIFVLIVAIVCTVQLVNREKYDAVIAYAGSKDVSKKAEGGDVAEIVTLQSSLKDVVYDVDKNGEISISLEALFWLSSEEIKALEAELAEKKENGETIEEINYSLLTSNYSTVDTLMLSGEYFLWFMSDDLYNYVNGKSDVERFVDLSAMPEGDTAVEFYGEDTCAVYLKSTEFYKMPGICDLPEDTLVVVRRLGIGANKGTKRAYESALDFAKEIINYEH